MRSGRANPVAELTMMLSDLVYLVAEINAMLSDLVHLVARINPMLDLINDQVSQAVFPKSNSKWSPKIHHAPSDYIDIINRHNHKAYTDRAI